MSEQYMTPVILTNPEGLSDPTEDSYSQVAVVAPNSRLIYVSSQAGDDVHGELPEDFHLQVRWAIANLATAVNAVDAELSDIVKLTVLVVDHSEDRLSILNQELDEAWGLAQKPTRTLIPVARLAMDGVLFEIDAVAVAPVT